MKNPLSRGQIILSVFIGSLLLVTIIPAALYFPARQLLLNPDAMTEVILASDLVEEIPNFMTASLESSLEFSQLAGNAYLDRLDRDDYREILARIAPPEWIVIQSAMLARQTQEFFLGRTDGSTFSLDLSEIKVRLAGKALLPVAEIIVASWDVCSQEQLVQFGLAIASGASQNAFPVCQPPEEYRPLVISGVEGAVRQFAEQIPQEVRFEAANTLSSSVGLGFLRFAVQVWPWTPWLALGLAVFMLIAHGGALRTGLLSNGIPFVLAGIIDFGIVLVFLTLRESVVQPWLSSWMLWLYPAGLASLLTTALSNLVGRFFLSALIWSGATVLIGAGLIVLSRVAKR